MREGGIAGVIHRHADRAYKQLGSGAEKALDLLLALTNSEGKPLTISLGMLRDKLDGTVVEPMVERLRQNRLVRVRGGDVELAHPAVASWPRLESSRLAAMDVIAIGERIAEAAVAWERSGCLPAYLGSSNLLAQMDRRGVSIRGLTGLEVQFLDDSRRARRRRRYAQLAIAVLCALLVASGLFYKSALDERRRQAEQKEIEARERARRVGLIARARQTDDPYARVAYLVAAINEGATEPGLFVELLGAAGNLPPGRFLAMSPVEAPTMPWNDRWVVGRSPAGAVVVFDLWSASAEPEVLEHLDVDLDPSQASVVFRRPKRFDLAVGGAPVHDIVPLAFDTALLALNGNGELHLLRLREAGDIALVAVAPMRCRGEVTVATRAAVAACVSGGGVAIWDMASGKTHQIEEPAGAFALAPDGQSLVAWAGRDISIHGTFDDRPLVTATIAEDVRVAAISPRDPVVALATSRPLLVVDAADPSAVLFEDVGPLDPTSLRWDDNGVDIAACKLNGLDRWYYARKGYRAPTDAPPSVRCDAVTTGAPLFAPSRFDLGALGMRDFGEHFSRGAFRLPRDKWLSSTLVLAGADDDGLERVLAFAQRDEHGRRVPVKPHDGFAKVVRQGSVVAVEQARSAAQIIGRQPGDILLLDAKNGKRMLSTPGFLLDGCPDGRILMYRTTKDRYDVLDLRTGAEIGAAVREPGLVVGVSPSCKKLYTQRLDGTLVVHDLARERMVSRAIAGANGFVFDVDASRAFAAGGPGLIIALSSGEIARIDERDDAVRVLAVASPRATAIGDGVEAGEILFADATGLHRVLRSGATERLAAPTLGATWQDAHRTADGRAVVLASSDQIAVVDVAERAIAANAPIKSMTRIAPWDEDGTVLVYAPDLEGLAHGVIVPFGQKISDAVGALASNLRVDAQGNLELKR